MLNFTVLNMEKTENYEERLQMTLEEKRLESFKHWPYSDTDKCNVAKMAEAGFFWTGTKDEPDSAQCFVCNKQMDGWESTDDPWEEHKSHSVNCPFVKIGKPEEFLTLVQFNELWKTVVKNLLHIKYDATEKKIMECYNKIRADVLHFQKNGCF